MISVIDWLCINLISFTLTYLCEYLMFGRIVR
jgi:hypothetical protein